MTNTTLKNEIEQTLMFFIKTDIGTFGHVTKGTVEAYKVQNVEFPKEYIEKIEK